jgi:hypothetical protein
MKNIMNPRLTPIEQLRLIETELVARENWLEADPDLPINAVIEREYWELHLMWYYVLEDVKEMR